MEFGWSLTCCAKQSQEYQGLHGEFPLDVRKSTLGILYIHLYQPSNLTPCSGNEPHG